MKAENLIGREFNRLTVTKRAGTNKQGNAMWFCECKCGSSTTARGCDLRSGHTQSCGCFSIDQTSAANTTHGQRSSFLYTIWYAMLRRCNNPNHKFYKYYGGRGIKVCERWHTFLNFIEDMPPCPGEEYTIDRKDNDGNYEPGNIRWATRSQQQANSRNCL